MSLISFSKVIPPIWGYVEVESWQKVISMGTWDDCTDWSQVNWQNLCKAGINKRSWSWAKSETLCGVSQSSSFHSDLFAESYQCTGTSRDYRAAEHPSQWAGWEDGRDASQTPCGGFSVFSRDQAICYCWVNIGPRLTLTAFVFCCLALRLQGVQHKENTASNEAALDLVGFISSSFML